MMKAAVINKFGDPSVFEVSNMDKPEINEDQILIQVYTSSINPIDWKQRKGNHKLILGSAFPIVLGYDVCGVVESVGKKHRSFKQGDLVYGVLDNKYGGAYAEYAVGNENCFCLKPDSISNSEAAAFPMVSLTALQALRDKAKVKEGTTVLVNGASGGVGHMVMQIAKLMGAKLIAVASTESKTFVEQFEPDEYIDYMKESVYDINYKVDVVFDIASNLIFRKSKKILKPNGIYINLEYINTIKKMPVYFFQQLFSKGKKVKSLLMKHSAKDLEIISNWIKGGRLKVHIDEEFSLKNISAAHDYAQNGHNKGKNVIVINN